MEPGVVIKISNRSKVQWSVVALIAALFAVPEVVHLGLETNHPWMGAAIAVILVCGTWGAAWLVAE